MSTEFLWGGQNARNWIVVLCIGEGNGNPLQCSCLENPRDGRAWWADVYGVTESRTQLKWLSSSSSSIPRMVNVYKCAGSRRETFHSWQRSWGRRLGIRKGGIKPRECPWIFSSIYPQKNQSLPTLLPCALTSDFTGSCPPPPSHSLCQRVNLQLQLIKFLGN